MISAKTSSTRVNSALALETYDLGDQDSKS